MRPYNNKKEMKDSREKELGRGENEKDSREMEIGNEEKETSKRRQSLEQDLEILSEESSVSAVAEAHVNDCITIQSQYDVDTIKDAAIYKPTYRNMLVEKMIEPTRVKLEGLYEAQGKRVLINVGGGKFECSTVTLTQDPSSVLAKMIKKDSSMRSYDARYLYTYFIDRDRKHFRTILNYLRSGAEGSFGKVLPTSHVDLQELLMEATFYELDGLVQMILGRI
ncbi:uncharacterized protein LOC117340390 [Pecten maximus]|uniref:uncharacterized protein LOC117340390 n=1 Tax=Pecten maximus TaxID=6579 RepID=UPI001458AE67|nr:uncharacterized protein LOC117340390 [Pecten maximus]